MYNIYFYVPESHLEIVKVAIFAKGAGCVGNYDCCAWQTLGMGQFRPLKGSQPAIGNINKLEKVAEYKVETICQEQDLSAVLEALLKSHPYESPAYGFSKVSTAADLLTAEQR